MSHLHEALGQVLGRVAHKAPSHFHARHREEQRGAVGAVLGGAPRPHCAHLEDPAACGSQATICTLHEIVEGLMYQGGVLLPLPVCA